MFLVINKEKVYAYVVSVFTILMLFVMSYVLNTDFNETKETSTKIEQNNLNTQNTISNNNVIL